MTGTPWWTRDAYTGEADTGPEPLRLHRYVVVGVAVTLLVFLVLFVLVGIAGVNAG